MLGPMPLRMRPVVTSMNDIAPDCDAIAIVRPSGLMTAADGARGAGLIATERRRRSERASKTVMAPASTAATREPSSIRPVASTPARAIGLVDVRRPVGSDHRARYVGPNPWAMLNTR